MASTHKKRRNGHHTEGGRGIEYDTARFYEPCLSESITAVPEVVPSPQAARMNDRDRET